jgi:hypothetical protein
MRHFSTLLALTAAAVAPVVAAPLVAPLSAQPASIVYKLGKDTVAIERFSRTASAMTGEMVQRSGAAVVRYTYSITLGKDGRPTAASIKRLNGDGSQPAGAPTDTRFTVRADSIVREAVFPDSTQRRAFAAKGALINFPVFVYGPMELLAALRKSGAPTDSVMALGAAGGPGFTGFQSAGGDTLRLRGGAYAMLMRFDASSKLLSVDGSFTTNKAIGARSATSFDLAALGKAWKPTGVLSAREDVRASFGPGGMVVIDYGRPSVRERTVWGGTLVPFDSVWRAGANDATHLFTTRPLTMGTLTLAPGMYSLWVQHTRSGTFLIVNKQTGQWGTQYDASQDLGKVALQMSPTPSHVEEFTIAVKALGATRGVIELSWGSQTGSVPFSVGVGVARP